MFISVPRTAFLLISSLITVLATPQVNIGSGTLLGVQTSVHAASPTANAYLGVPFAKPPARFLPPESADPINGTFNATKWPAACVQQSSMSFLPFNATDAASILTSAYNVNESEDCLYLNVFTPTNATINSRLPVMFWIYGGNLQSGSISLTPYNAASLAASQNVIVVTANYRLGVFGFVPSEELDITKRNPGFLDQRLAIDWVYSNILNFGGDPSSVTLFGESAGGYSVKQLWANPPTPLRFRAAIMESEGVVIPTNGWSTFVQRVNCSNAASPLKCIQDLPTSVVKNATIVDETGSVPANPLSVPLFPPTVDHVTFTDRPEVAVTSGKAAHVPILIGTNVNESANVIYGLDQTSGAAELELFLNSSAVSALYPSLYSAALAFGADSPEQATSHINNQFLFTCPVSILTTTAAIAGYPVWRYFFNATFSELNLYPDQIKYGAYHGSEVFSVFGTYPAGGSQDAAQAALSQYVQGLWAGFARDPKSSLPWPKVNSAAQSLFRIAHDNAANGSVISSGVADYDCGLYDEFILSIARV